MEYPWRTYRGPSYHYAVDAGVFKGFYQLFGSAYIAVAYYRNFQVGQSFYACDCFPVGFAAVQLRPCASVYGQCAYAAVLQLQGQSVDYFAVVVPSKASLYGYRQVDGINHRTGDFEQFRHIAQQSGTGAFARHLLHRTTEVDVDEVGAGLGGYTGCLSHYLGLTAINLYGRGPFGRIDLELAGSGGDIAYECIGRHELCVRQVAAHLFADEPERSVGDVLHRSEHHRFVAKINVCYFHINIPR